jgi:hypothetical protein
MEAAEQLEKAYEEDRQDYMSMLQVCVCLGSGGRCM